MAKSKSGTTRRRNQIRQRQKRRGKRVKAQTTNDTVTKSE